MNLRHLSDDQLHGAAIESAATERKATLQTLHHLKEIERRKLFSQYGCSSLHAYCVKVLKFSESQAGRRVAASRLLKDLPVIEEKMLNGSLNLTNVAQAAVFFIKEKRAGQTFDHDQKLNLMMDLESTSTRKADQILIAKSNQPEIHLRESVKIKTATHTEVRLHFDQETLQAIEKMKEIWSAAMPIANLADVIKRMALESVERHDPMKKAERAVARAEKADAKQSSDAESTTSSDLNSNESGVTLVEKTQMENSASKSQISHQVRLRDSGCCTFKDPQTGERCGSKFFLEEDHIIPKAMGGAYSLENIRLRCRAHNQRHAIDVYGFEKMNQHFRTSN